jgi:diacylglycerol kinase family enzyme
MGGDGTISEVARGLITSGLARQVPLGLLPTGTANDIGHSFGLSSSESALERNVDVLAVGAEVDLDAGLLTAQTLSGQRQELFVDSVGFGFGPRILRMRNQERRLVEGIPIVRELYRDHLLYAASAVKALGESYLADDKFDVQVVADGKRLAWKNLNDLVIKGPRIYAGLWVLDPESRSDDGLFEVVPFSGRRDWLSKALLYLDHSGELEADLKELGISHSQGLRAARIEVTLTPHERGQVPAQVDGEEFPSADRFLVEVLPRALRLVVPAAPA